MSLDIWLNMAPCIHCGRGGGNVFSTNITHNLGAMADEGGFYDVVWRPELNDITLAGQLIKPLTKAIADMKADSVRFEKHNAENGWGLYEHFLPWLEKYLEACKLWPNASIEICR